MGFRRKRFFLLGKTKYYLKEFYHYYIKEGYFFVRKSVKDFYHYVIKEGCYSGIRVLFRISACLKKKSKIYRVFLKWFKAKIGMS